MPYNNTPIAPSKEVTGHVSLPLARVQKIIQADPERLTVSKNAAFAIALATEMFIQHLATTTHNVVKAERKPRRNIQYRDVSSAVAKTDNLEFAGDVVPKTVTYKEHKKKVEEREAEKKGKGKEKENEGEGANGSGKWGQTTLGKDGRIEGTNGKREEETVEEEEEEVAASPMPEKAPETPDAMDVDDTTKLVEDSDPEDNAAAMQIEMEMRGPPQLTSIASASASASPEARRSGGFTAINGTK